MKRLSIMFLLIILWQGSMMFFNVQSYVVPQPLEISHVLFTQKSLLVYHSFISLSQVFLGLLGGIILAFMTCIFLDKVKQLENACMPYLIALKNLPIFVLAPIFFIWFGYGLLSKAILITLSCYFPMAVALLDGLKQTPHHAKEFLHSTPSASYFPSLFWVRLPYALPNFFTGMKLAFLHAPVSVIACDWIGAHSGLGYLLMLSYGRMDMGFMFAVILLLLFYGVVLYKVASLIQKSTVRHILNV